MKILVAVLAIALVPRAASADGALRKSLGEGYELVVAEPGGALEIRKGKLRAKLGTANGILKVTVDKKTRVVEADTDDDSCSGKTHYTWELANLDARLENTAAYALHKKKDDKAAAEGFARAAAADPTWKIPAYNLASALTLLGDKDAAIKALAPWLAADPVATYVQVTTDPELSPLLDRPEVRAIRSKKPGSIKLFTGRFDGDLDGDISFSPDRSLLAMARTERSWGACSYQTDLEIRDVATGKLVASTPIVAWSETAFECDEKASSITPRGRAAVARRVVALQTMLNELGFVRPKLEAGSAVQRDDDKTKSQFPKAKLGIVAKLGSARVLQQDTVLATAPVLDLLARVMFVEDARAIVAWSTRTGREGCEGTDPTSVTVIALPPAPSAKP